MTKIQCAECGKDYLPRTPRQIVCGLKSTRARAYSAKKRKKGKPPLRACKCCQKPLRPRQKTWCSDACRTRGLRPTECTSCGDSLADAGPGSTLCADCRAVAR